MKNLGVVLVASATLIVLAGIGAVTYATTRSPQTITITGSATESFAPDKLVASLSLQEVSMDQTAASALLIKRVDALKASLKTLGIEDKMLDQGNVTIGQYFDYTNPTPPTGGQDQKKQVSQTLTLTLEKSKIGDIASMANKITTAITALSPGVDNYSFYYDFIDRSKVSETLRQKAVTDASQKASSTLSTLGSSTGKVVSIAENNSSIGVPYPLEFNKSMMSAGPGGFSTSPTNQEITFSVTVTFEIKSNKVLGIF